MPRDNIDGVLLLNKPRGLSSNTALQKVKHLFNAVKAGHTGTLDPLASGLLPICFGEATKFSSFLLDGDKEYLATIKLGKTTTTYDAEGEVITSCPVTCNWDEVLDCILSFKGQITQIPPIYSALKVNGKALYEYARNGEEVEIKARQVFIYELVAESLATDTIRVRILCSKGTYIRSLAHDIGQQLGCGAHLIELIRTKTNEFKLENSFTLETLTNLSLMDRQQHLLPSDIMLAHVTLLNLDEGNYSVVKHGHEFNLANALPVGVIRLYYQSKFLGVANSNGYIVAPRRLINTANLNSD